MGGHKKRSSNLENSELMDALNDMEPELHQLEGILTVLRTLGESQDSVEPVAISALARSGGDALAVVRGAWRIGFDATRRGSAR